MALKKIHLPIFYLPMFGFNGLLELATCGSRWAHAGQVRQSEVIEYSKYNLLQAKRLVWQRFSVLLIYLFFIVTILFK